jgi:hypothetical protein
MARRGDDRSGMNRLNLLKNPPHSDLCSALRNAADTNVMLPIEKFSPAYDAKTRKMNCP